MQVGKEDVFEREYVAKFRLLASKHGEFVQYERDRAARDIGLHFTRKTKSGKEIVTSTLAWFQLKGLHTNTLTSEDLEKNGKISISLAVSHLKFWYLQTMATYLVVYAESVDKFFLINIRKHVADTWGSDILTDTAQTKTVSFAISGNVLDDDAFERILCNGDILVWKEHIEARPDLAALVVRDMEVIKTIGTADERHLEQRVLFKPWLSKSRTEVIFQQRKEAGDWEVHHEHWQFLLGHGLERAFPYLTFTASEVLEDDEEVDSDDDYGPELELNSGEKVKGKNCADEFELYELHPSLNDIGKSWLGTIDIMEKAGFVEVDLDKFISVSVHPKAFNIGSA